MNHNGFLRDGEDYNASTGNVSEVVEQGRVPVFAGGEGALADHFDTDDTRVLGLHPGAEALHAQVAGWLREACPCLRHKFTSVIARQC